MIKSTIHTTAIIADIINIGEGTTVGPYSVIGPNVRIGRNNKIRSHVVLDGNTIIGDNNDIFPFAAIGLPPQDQKWKGEDSELIIGDNNIIREYVTIQPGTAVSFNKTTIGNNNLFMAYVHIAHDVTVGSGCWIANGSQIGGHVEIDDYAVLGGMSGVHQFTRIGKYAMIGVGSIVTMDVPHFCLAVGNRAQLIHINSTGLRRHNFADDAVNTLRNAFRKLFYEPGILTEKIEILRNKLRTCTHPGNQQVREMVEFIASSKRGVCPYSKIYENAQDPIILESF